MTTAGEPAVMIHALTETQIGEIVRQAEIGYPEEICGIVVGKPGSPDTYRVCQVQNIANRERQQDTTGVERDARTAYRMDDREVLRILRQADVAGWDVVTFYHSHPDHPSLPSERDRRWAEEIWRSSESWSYVILEVAAGRLVSWRSWVLREGVFQEEPVEIAAGP